MRADGRNPVVIFAELIAGRSDLKSPNQRQRNGQAEEAEYVANHALRVVELARHKQQHNRTNERRE